MAKWQVRLIPNDVKFLVVEAETKAEATRKVNQKLAKNDSWLLDRIDKVSE